MIKRLLLYEAILWALGDLVEEFVLSKILGITTVPKNDGNPYKPVKMDDKRF
jgi:hypothetical protein